MYSLFNKNISCLTKMNNEGNVTHESPQNSMSTYEIEICINEIIKSTVCVGVGVLITAKNHV